MTVSLTYHALLRRAASALAPAGDPVGSAAVQALLLAAHTGLHHGDVDDPVAWDLYTVAITVAVADVQAELPDQVVLAGVPTPVPAGVELRPVVTDLVRRLADLYATAATRADSAPGQGLTWARVAHQLDDAVAELA
jgi:hypothetical protein